MRDLHGVTHAEVADWDLDPRTKQISIYNDHVHQVYVTDIQLTAHDDTSADAVFEPGLRLSDRFEIVGLARRSQSRCGAPFHRNTRWWQVDVGDKVLVGLANLATFAILKIYAAVPEAPRVVALSAFFALLGGALAALAIALPADKRVRDLVVSPHKLDDYDQLQTDTETENDDDNDE